MMVMMMVVENYKYGGTPRSVGTLDDSFFLFCFCLKMDGTNSGGFLFVYSVGTSKWLAWHSQPKTYSLEKGERERQRSTVCVIITKIDLVLLLSYYTMDVDRFDENQTENNKDYYYVEDGGKPTPPTPSGNFVFARSACLRWWYVPYYSVGHQTTGRRDRKSYYKTCS